MDQGTTVLRLTAFASEPSGGNPAGVVLDASALSTSQMQQIATDIGYAETAFVTRPATPAEPCRVGIRYFSPTAEVPFCGHATIATAVALANRGEAKTYLFETPIGEVKIETHPTAAGTIASFTSVEPRVESMEEPVLQRLMTLLGIVAADLHPHYPPRLSFAGNIHPVIVFAQRSAFDSFTFDPDGMRALMDERGWSGTVTTLYAITSLEFEARNLFPVGTMSEDPATGSAAASVGGYLRALRLVNVPVRITIRQGRHIGRPSILTVDIPATGGIVVSGTASVIH
ncbi:PhzF family phenazine biosynthesis protein [Arthrobacter sp. H14-L1]|uniref:PhzF family phenazine biosynthesis protein n=1 Tax=Arthrobacter sp. H14-L1 TaxID=2996697 RepID=UPI00226E6310|nr:PhzF family phenazine biosynthesis protein [Arthrobacter sp. H14-L1]MCY0906174.1 PhzF family phenazine biosynthesis protein [Arthrobacter sp. H14-L1]